MNDGTPLDKDDAIIDLVKTLDFEARGWMIVDHWEGDRSAIGIATSANPERLAYVSTWDKSAGHYFVEFETPDASDELGYTATRIDECTASELTALLETHLA